MGVQIDKSFSEVIFTAPSCGSKVSVDKKAFLNMLNDLILTGSAYFFAEGKSVSLKRKRGKVSISINITRQGSPFENYNPNDPPSPGGVTVISHDALPFEMEYLELEKIRGLIIESRTILVDQFFSAILLVINKKVFIEEDIKIALKGFQKEDLPELREKLIDFRSKKKSVSDKSSEVLQEEVNHDRSFGKESMAMSDYYDNESRVIINSARGEFSAIDKVIAFLDKISK